MKELIEQIKSEITSRLEDDTAISDEKVITVIEEMIFERSRQDGRNLAVAEKIIKTIQNDILGFGVLQHLFEDNEITEIMINSGNVFYEKAGIIYKADILMDSSDDCMKLIRTICRKSGRTVNTAAPITDACLDDGTRINIVLNPVSVDGHAVTIRKFPEKPMTGNDLVEAGFCTEESIEFLKKAYMAKYNIFICGGAGTGKTTLLNVLVNYTDNSERIITIEDSAELRIDDVENIVRLEARIKNTEGKGAVSIRELIRASLRMRPDRIIVGEVRGEEAIDMLQAMNTGHEGSISTGHANSCEELISRLETMVITDRDIPLRAVRKQIVTAIDIIVCVSKPGGRRCITEISEVIGIEKGEAVLRELFLYNYREKNLVRMESLYNTEKMNRMLYE